MSEPFGILNFAFHHHHTAVVLFVPADRIKDETAILSHAILERLPVANIMRQRLDEAWLECVK